MTFFICTTCAVQFDDRDRPPESCPVCSDPRQYVPAGGQQWTTLEEIRRDHTNEVAPQGDLIGIGPRDGLGGIAISHPHFYSSMAEWAHRFDCPIHLPRTDAEWIMRPDPAIRLWDGG